MTWRNVLTTGTTTTVMPTMTTTLPPRWTPFPTWEVDLTRPVLVGDGPAEFSCGTALARSPEVCHDVNGYYRALGVHWRASTRQLRRAYQRLGTMPPAYATYALTQLRDPVIRRNYDRAPLGSVFLDRYVIETVTRLAKAQMAARGNDIGDLAGLQEQLARMGFGSTSEPGIGDLGPDAPAADTPPEKLDTDPPEVDDGRTAEKDPPPPWGYAHYLWRSTSQPTDRLRTWQSLLVAALRQRGLSPRLAVGFQAHTDNPWVITRVGGRTVVFLHPDTEPTPELARDAAEHLHTQYLHTRLHP